MTTSITPERDIQDKVTPEKSSSQHDGKIILLKGQSQYDVVRIFIDDVAEGFRQLGHDAIVVDMMQEDYFKKIASIKGKAKCFFSFNGMGTGLEVNQQPLFDYLGTPLVTWHVDHPFYLQDRINYPMKRSVVIVSNENYYQFYLKHYRKPGVVSKCLQIAGRQYVKELVPYDKRENDLVFFGSCMGPLEKQAQLLNSKDKTLNELIWETVEAAKYEQEIELSDIFYANLQHMGLNHEELPQPVLQYFLSNMDVYLRIFRRRHVLNALKDFPLKIYGNGWEDFDGEKNNFTFYKAATFIDTLEIMSKSKLTLNVMPNNRTGIHDRISYGMHQGAVCLSDATPGMKQDIEHNQHVLFYDMASDLSESLPQKVHEALGDLNNLETVAEKAMHHAKVRFNWTDRASEIIRLVDTHNMAMALTNASGA